MRRAIVRGAGAATFAIWLACSGLGGNPEPEPPAFNDITDDQLESAMWQLADGIERLQALFGNPGPIRPDQRPEVVQILDQMIAAADELGPAGVETHHVRITHNLGDFREKLVIARNSAAMNPPRYYLVGNLSGTCFACHGSR
jgi:hypothetical protein